jgi:hypothetical protein
MGWNGMDLAILLLKTDQWRDVLNTVINLPFAQTIKNFQSSYTTDGPPL